MVLFENIKVGQLVEVIHHNCLNLAKVRYAGSLPTRLGDWVGLELQNPIGYSDGLFRGRRLFIARRNHGIFTTADKIRFIPMTRCLFDKYHCVDKNSMIDAELAQFKADPIDLNEPAMVSDQFIESTARLIERIPSADPWNRSDRYPLGHQVGNTIPAATMTQPRSTQLTYFSTPIHSRYHRCRPLQSARCSRDEHFISPPSVPDYHIPREAELRQMRRGWSATRFPKHVHSYLMRDSLHHDWWNDVSY